jgi:UDP-N-acetylglucosamine acyltransferase
MTSTTTLDIRSIKEILPHRYPALLLDKVLQIDPRKYIVGIKNVTINEPIFQGHFDDAPILPGVLILESLLQTGATLFLQDPEYYGRYAFFASIKEAEFLQKVIPGDQLRLEMEVTKISKNIITMKGQALVEGEVVCSGIFSFNLSQRPSKPQIHATASVHHTAVLGKNVIIGANTIVGEHVHIGDNTTLEANCFIEKWTRIGEACNVHFGCVIGSKAQDMKYAGEKSWVTIGNNNEIREYVTINRATGENEITSIGSDNIFLTHVHIAHNCKLGNNIIIANTTNLGGHSIVEDKAVIGGMTGIHQFVRIGAQAMVGAYTRLPQDVPPFTICEGNPALIRGLNSIGLKRNGASKESISEIKEVFNLVYKSTITTATLVKQFENHTYKSDQAKQFIKFFTAESKRGISKKQISKSST